METFYLVLAIGLYGFFVNLNYVWFKDLMQKEEDRVFASKFWFYIFSGPILASFVIYKKICVYRRKQAIKKAIMEQLPDLLKEYNITVKK